MPARAKKPKPKPKPKPRQKKTLLKRKRPASARGKAVSPYDNLVIDGDYIKAAAQSGDMSQLLYAVAVRKPSGERTFRAPNEADLQAL